MFGEQKTPVPVKGLPGGSLRKRIWSQMEVNS